MFLEPCCIENQLPQLLRRERGHALFQTNGDVTIEKLMQAACCMASGGFGEYWIVVREADVVLMRFLRHWMQRGWIRHLHLLTATDQRALVAGELGDGLAALCDYGWRDGLSLEAFIVVGDRESMVVQGEMLLQPRTEAVMTAYSASVGPNARMLSSDGDAGSLIDNLRAMLRVQKRRKRKSSGSDPSDTSAPSAASSAAPLGSDPDRASQGDAQSASDPQSQSASDPESQSASDPNSEG